MIIYKITNKVNNKVYIGLTTLTLEYRWKRHITESKNVSNEKHLYKAIRKYGLENFLVEEIDHSSSLEELGELERKYIKQFDSTNPNRGYNLTAGGERHQYDGNSQSKLTVEDVIEIRKAYAEGIYRVKEYWKKYYSDKMSFSGFQKVWDGYTWIGIMDEVYTVENVEKHKNQRANFGESAGNSVYTNAEVFKFRQYYVNHTLKETYEKYGSKMSKSGFRSVLDGGTFSNIPKYSKVRKVWLLEGKEIDIVNYKPVSTICGSAE